jgi:hypothetical protein
MTEKRAMRRHSRDFFVAGEAMQSVRKAQPYAWIALSLRSSQ